METKMQLQTNSEGAPKQVLPGKTVVGEMLERIAKRPEAGVKEIIFEEWGYAGMIVFNSGKHAFFRGSSIGLNTIAPADIAKDKGFTKFFLDHMGYRTVPGKTFFSSKWAEAIKSDQNIEAAFAYAQKIGFPLIVKPNSGSQGRGVARVENEQEFFRAINVVFEMDRVAIVEKLVSGKDYRVVVLDDRIISAYERIPLNVVGDGRSNVMQLLQEKQEYFKRVGRDTKIKFDDPRMSETLALQNSTFDSVPPEGVHVQLLTNANLSSGGDAVDVTEKINDNIRELCIKLTKDMGLRLCGVDLMLPNGIGGGVVGYYILEINAAPGLDHYANIGEKQDKVVEDLYLEVVKSMNV